jgi:hypothetical protein
VLKLSRGAGEGPLCFVESIGIGTVDIDRAACYYEVGVWQFRPGAKQWGLAWRKDALDEPKGVFLTPTCSRFT